MALKRVVATARLGALVAALSANTSCSSSAVRLYSGPERPASEVAQLVAGPGARIVGVDGNSVNVREGAGAAEVLPGCHRVQVTFQARFEKELPPESETRSVAREVDTVTRHEPHLWPFIIPFAVARRFKPTPSTRETRYEVGAQFDVKLDPSHRYEVLASLIGDEFTPRLVVIGPTGERLGAMPALPAAGPRRCYALEQVAGRARPSNSRPEVAALRRAFAEAEEMASRCLQPGSQPELSLPVEVTFAASGRVTRAELVAPSPAGVDAACVSATLVELTVPPFTGAPATVRKQLRLRGSAPPPATPRAVERLAPAQAESPTAGATQTEPLAPPAASQTEPLSTPLPAPEVE